MAPERSPGLAANADRFSGFAGLYDDVRPRPPDELAQVLTTYGGTAAPHVVDLGGGTGLSTRWAGTWADSVVGVEPNPDMRAVADHQRTESVRFVEGFSHDTGLAGESADIVMAVQAFHWMEPIATLAEVARLLRPGGVFAAIDCDWPPTVGSAELEGSWSECRTELRVFEARLAAGMKGDELRRPIGEDDPAKRGYSGRDAHRERVLAKGVQSWSKDSHLDRMVSSGHFAWCHELALHRPEQGDAERFVDLLRSQGDYQTLRQSGLDDDVLGVSRLADVASAILGAGTSPWWFTYRVRIGVASIA